MTDSTAPVTFEEISRWLMNRDPWPCEILQAIARAATRTGNSEISSNHLLRDPAFQIAGNQVNTIPAGFRTCCSKGWLVKTGTEPTETLRGHGRDVKVYGITPEGRVAFARIMRIAEVGAGNNGENRGEPVDSPPPASPDLGEDRLSDSRSPSGTTGADPDGDREEQPHPSGQLPLPGLEPPNQPGHIDLDQREAA